MRILVAEDESKVAAFLEKGLREEGYAVDLAVNGDEAIWLAENHPYDAWVIDILMPGKDGISVIRHLRRRKHQTPAILLTARTRVEDRILGLDAGADGLDHALADDRLAMRLTHVLHRAADDFRLLLVPGVPFTAWHQ